MSIQATITLGQLQQSFEENNFNFLCFAAEWIVEKTLGPDEYVQAESLSMWRALYKLDSELFKAPPTGTITFEQQYRDAVVLNYWMNPELEDEYSFVKELGSREYNSNGHTNRRALLGELVKRHGTGALLDLEFVEV
jgi:hypothetical protein